ncbi:MAG: hypothetical protein ACOCVC_04855 [Spirochaeta sp.]
MNRVTVIDDSVPVRSALISVSDKSGLDELVLGLSDICPGIKIYSTGGTYSAVEAAIAGHNLHEDIELIAIPAYTGQPEMQGGLVKTLDFKIYLGLLSETYNDSHRMDHIRTGAEVFDLTVVNLYPFQETIARPDCSLEDARANIDIGGPTMIRASAKNYLRVAAVCRPAEYPDLLNHLRNNRGATNLEYRFQLAKTAFAHTAEYESAISNYLNAASVDSDQYQFKH